MSGNALSYDLSKFKVNKGQNRGFSVAFIGRLCDVILQN